jgi:hypothetical protein
MNTGHNARDIRKERAAGESEIRKRAREVLSTADFVLGRIVLLTLTK